MRWLLLVLALLAGTPSALRAQAEYRVYNDHPRLFLTADRLRRIERDAERRTARWNRLAARLEAGDFAEPAFARALAYQAGKREADGRLAVEWALQAAESGLTEPGELRQAAIVFDWCQPLLSDEERERLARALADRASAVSQLSGREIAPVSEGVLAAVALAGHWEGSEPLLGGFLERQWEQDVLPLLLAGELVDRQRDLLALIEICHAIRGNLDRDLWRDAPEAFHALPLPRILSYYPDTLESEEGLLRRPSEWGTGAEAPARVAALARIVEMVLVGYDVASQDFQFLQGWLRNDSFTLIGPLGVPYEFLWINPYTPGLSPSSALYVAYDPVRGRLFARQGWDENSLWAGYRDGRLQIFSEGEAVEIRPRDQQRPLQFPGGALALANGDGRLTVDAPEAPARGGAPEAIYVGGLVPGRSYDVKVDKHSASAYVADRGGLIVIRAAPIGADPSIHFDKRVKIQIRAASGGAAPTLTGRR